MEDFIEKNFQENALDLQIFSVAPDSMSDEAIQKLSFSDEEKKEEEAKIEEDK